MKKAMSIKSLSRKAICFLLSILIFTSTLPLNTFANQQNYSSTTEVSATFGTTPVFDGLSAVMSGDGGNHEPVVTSPGGIECWSMQPSTDRFYMYCDVEDSFINGGVNNVEIDVEYYDAGEGGMFTLLYDSTNDSTKQAEVVKFTNDNTWKIHTFKLGDAKFSNGFQYNDMRIGAFVPVDGMSKADVNIRKITVRKIIKNSNEVSATFGTIPVFDGLSAFMSGDGGNHGPVVTSPGGIECWSMQPSTDRFYMYCNVEDSFINGGVNNVEIDVEYYDAGEGGMFTLLYDSTNDPYKQAEVVKFTNDNIWKTHTFKLGDAKFSNGFAGQDMRIGAFIPGEGMSSADINIRKITVRKIANVAPVEANPQSGAISKGTQVTLTTETTDAEIYYTNDGTDPLVSASKVLYTAPITIDKNTVIMAYATKNEMAASTASTFKYYTDAIDVTVNDFESQDDGWKIKTDINQSDTYGFKRDTTVFYSGQTSGKLYGDFTNSGESIEIEKEIKLEDIVSFNMFVKSEDIKNMRLRAKDITGQYHEVPIVINSGEWQQISLKNFKGGTHSDGANDGTWHAPVTALSIVVKKSDLLDGKSSFTLWTDDIKVLSPFVNKESVSATLGIVPTISGLDIWGGDNGAGFKKIVVNGKECWQTNKNDSALYLYCNIDDGYIFNEECNSQITVEYLDKGNGKFTLQYDAGSGAEVVELKDSGEWKTYTFSLNNVSLGNNMNGADFRLAIWATWMGESSEDVCFSKVTVKKMDAQAIKVQTVSDKVGNIYTDKDALNLGVSLTNTTYAEKNIAVNYRVLNHNDYTLLQGTLNLDIKPFATIIEKLDLSSVKEFGTFNIEVNVEGDNGSINQQKVFPFSKILVSGVDNSDGIFGVMTHFAQSKGDIEKNLLLADQAGVEWIRDEMYWGDAEKTKGVIEIRPDWDKYINTAISRGIQPLLILGYGNSFYDGGKAPKSAEAIKGYVNYVTEVAKHFQNRVSHFEIWNEWNGGLGNPDKLSPEDYAKLFIEASKAIKTVNPEAFIIGGATAGADITWIKRVIDAGAYDYIDAVSMHPYSYPASPEDGNFASSLNSLRGIFGDKEVKPIWITEIGWPTHDVDKGGVTEMTSAAYAVRMYAWALANKDMVDKIFWYDFQNDGVNPEINEDNFGMIKSWVSSEAIAWAAKASYVALSALTSKIDGAKYVREYTFGDDINAYQFHRDSDNKDLMVLWTTKDSKNLGLNVGNADVVLSDILGNPRNIKPTEGSVNVSVSQVPIYIEGTFGNDVTVATSSFYLDAMAFNVVPGDTLTIGVNRTEAAMKLEGEYQINLPEGWNLTNSDTTFTTGEAINKLSVSVPQNVKCGSYDISIYPVSGGNSLGAFKVTVIIVKPYTLEIIPASAKQGDWSKWKLDVNIKNNTSTLPVNGVVKLLEPSDWDAVNGEQAFSIKAGLSKKVEILVKENPGQTLYSVKMQVTLENGAIEIIEKKVSFLGALEAEKPIIADGKLTESEWAGAMSFNLDSESQFIKLSNEQWSGIDDLSGKGYIKWDMDNIYLGLSVVDDAHFQQGTGSDIWSGDGIQFSLDPGRRYGPGSYGWNEMGFALNSEDNTTYNWKWSGAAGKNTGLMDKVTAVVKREGKTTTYEAVMPLSDLIPNGIDIKSGTTLGFSLLINENDESGRYGWLEYMSGIGLNKDVNAYGDLVLVSKENPTPSPSTGGNGSNTETTKDEVKIDLVDEDTVKVTVGAAQLDADTATAKVTISNTVYNKLLNTINGMKEEVKVQIEIPKVNGALGYTVELPKEAVSLKGEGYEIEIKTVLGTVTIPQNMFDEKELSDKKVFSFTVSKADTSSIDKHILEEIGSRPVVEFNATIDGKQIAWSNPDAPVKVAIDYIPSAEELKNPEHIVVWYIDGEGKAFPVYTARYDVETGKVTFTTTHFSKYAVAFVEKGFKDTGKMAWAYKQIEVLAAKGIIDTEGDYYEPQVNISRGEFISQLIKALGLTADVGENFSDVRVVDKYYNEISIAKTLAITSGMGNNKFNPNTKISRQDAFVLTQKALSISGKLSVKGDVTILNKYKDASIIANYAKEAIATLVEAQIVYGQAKDCMLPKGNITKAEAAVMAYNCFNR